MTPEEQAKMEQRLARLEECIFGDGAPGLKTNVEILTGLLNGDPLRGVPSLRVQIKEGFDKVASDVADVKKEAKAAREDIAAHKMLHKEYEDKAKGALLAARYSWLLGGAAVLKIITDLAGITH